MRGEVVFVGHGDEETSVFNRGGELGTISMTSYIFN